MEAENTERIENAHHELEEITSTISKKTAEIGDLNILIEKKQAEAAEIESIISRKQKLAQEVETKVAEKIKAARENVADFICEMTFGGIPAVTAEQECIITHNDEIIDSVVEYLEKLIERGKLQAKSDINAFLNKLRKGIHEADPEDAELITRFEMQRVCPDILITNYSMLEYMLLRPREKAIWDNTKEWLHSNKDHKLLFTIDEAHMYRGSSGGEVALLIRRLFHKLEINRDKVQFILTTASMPHGSQEDREAVENFAYQLTASEKNPDFVFISGKPQNTKSNGLYEIAFSKFENISPKDFDNNDTRLSALNNFWCGLDNTPSSFESCEDAYYWMFDNLLNYRPFNELITRCRGNAVSLNELSAAIFPEVEMNKALEAVSILLAIAPLARNNDSVLFPARMHMLFRGIQGVYACANKNCPHSSSDNSLTLEKVFINDQNMTCPECGSVVYEIYNDRRCGALFYKGYVSEEDMASNEIAYLWHYPGQNIDNKVKEIHLFIPYENIPLKKDMSGVKTCYLDVHSGFLYLKDDAVNDNPNFRKLYYGTYENKETLPHTLTFTTCPHCLHRFSETQLTSLSTRGNQSFFNLVKTQFELQPSVPGKDIERMPNEGRKVLLFSDSRQRAAKLARDMSEISETEASRQLFVIAIKLMEESDFEYSLDMLYDFICLVAAKNHLQMFHDDNRSIFIEHCKEVLENYNESIEDDSEYEPENSFSSNAPISMQKQLIRMFSGGYNTLYDSAVSWLEPTRKKMKKCIKSLQKSGIIVDEEQFLEMFNAWIMYVCDSSTAIGHTISEKVRKSVRKTYDYHYGLKSDRDFSKTINGIMKWKKNSKEKEIWKEVFNTFLETSQENNTGMKYVDIATVRPRYNPDHTWYRCEICSEITPFLLRGHCNCCGSSLVHPFTGDDFKSLEFWHNTINSAINGEVIRVINTEEHTAQLSHKDQRDDMWSKTEKYEMLFQELIQK